MGDFETQDITKDNPSKKKKKLESNQRKIIGYIVILACFVILFMQLVKMEKQLKEQQNSLQTIQSQLQSNVSEISGIVNRIQVGAEEQNAIFEEVQYEDLRMQDGKVHMKFSAVPKVVKENQKVAFQVSYEEKTVTLAGETTDGVEYTAMAEFPFCSVAEYRVLLQNGKETQVQDMGMIYLEEELAFGVNSYTMGGYSFEDGKLIPDRLEVQTELDWYQESNTLTLKQIELVIFIDGKESQRIPMKKNGENSSEQELTYKASILDPISLKANMSVEFVVMAEDTNGLQYRQRAGYFVAMQDGELQDRMGDKECVIESLV